MPLFGRRLFQINEDDICEDSNEDKTIYTIEHTGERIPNRKLYEKLSQIYALERWTCQCTWRAGLTHRDAYQSEIDTRKSLLNLVPEYFHKIIFEILYHSVKPLEKIAEEISILLGQGFVIHEPVQFKKRRDTTVVKGTIERIDENDDYRKRTSERTSVQCRPLSDKQMKNVKYAIRLADEDRVISNVQPNELQRSQLLPNREKLKTFIRSYAIRLGNRADSPWIFYDKSIQEKYQIKDRISSTVIETHLKSMTITLDEILREQERILRKQAEEQEALLGGGGGKRKSNGENHNTSSQNGHSDEVEIILSDDEDKPKKSTPKKSKSSPTKQSRSSTKSKKQLTLHDMKFAKNSNSKKSPTTTYNVAVPYSLLQKLDKTRRDRGIQSKLFQRLVLHSARTLNEKQRSRLPEEYRSIIQKKFEELELKRHLSEMTEQEKKSFLQKKNQEKLAATATTAAPTSSLSGEDLDFSSSKILPLPKQIQTLVDIPEQHIGDLLVIYTFFTSCHSLFLFSFNDELAKTTQQFLRSFKLTDLLQTSQNNFNNYFLELLQILMKLLLKEDETRRANDETNSNIDDEQQQQPSVPSLDQQDPSVSTNPPEQLPVDDDIEQVYDIKLTEIPLTQFTCLELTRLYLSKEKESFNRIILEKLSNAESKDLSIAEQIDLLLFLVNQITTNSEMMSDYFEYLTRTVSETSRERNQLLAERRKAQEEESKEKKIQLQNSEPSKITSKKAKLPSKTSLGTNNDENHQSSPSTISNQDNDEIDSGGDEDLKTVIQRRRQMVAMSKELKEKRELQAQKLQNDQKRDLAIEKAEQAHRDALHNLQFGLRIKPLGFDRYYNRYWFFRGHAGLFVEKGWIGPNINYSVQISSNTNLINGERLIPRDELNQWWTYDSESLIEQLVQSLNDRGIREHELLINLKKILPVIRTEFEQIKKEKLPSEDIVSTTDNSSIDQSSNDILVSFKNDLEDIEIRLRSGSLGGFIINDNLIEWQTKLKQATERIQLADLLIQLQQTVAEKYASGIFGTHENRSKTAKNSSRKKSMSSTKVSTQHLPIWMNDCRTCKTFSRLYVLMLMFENAIAWSKSTVGIKCKICRRKTKDEYIVVCDQCCQGYHLECLRGCVDDPTKNSINDLWYCPACRPQTNSRRRARDEDKPTKSKMDYYDADIYDMDVDTTSNMSSHISDVISEQSHNNPQQDESELMNDDYLCSICAGETSDDNELIQCIQCRRLFHCQCHEPPLRCPPRSTTWMCNSCRNGVNNISKRIQTRGQLASKRSAGGGRDDHSRRQSSRQNGTRRTVRKNYREIDEDEDDDDESDYERETRNQRRSKRVRRLSPASTIDTLDKSDENFDIRPTRRRVRIARSSSSSSSEVSDEEKILADIHDDDDDDGDDNINDESAVEDEDEQEQEQENGNIDDISPPSQ